MWPHDAAPLPGEFVSGGLLSRLFRPKAELTAPKRAIPVPGWVALRDFRDQLAHFIVVKNVDRSVHGARVSNLPPKVGRGYRSEEWPRKAVSNLLRNFQKPSTGLH